MSKDAGSSARDFRALSIQTHERNDLLNEPDLASTHYLPAFLPGPRFQAHDEHEEPPQKPTLVNLTRHKFQLNQRHNSQFAQNLKRISRRGSLASKFIQSTRANQQFQMTSDENGSVAATPTTLKDYQQLMAYLGHQEDPKEASIRGIRSIRQSVQGQKKAIHQLTPFELVKSRFYDKSVAKTERHVELLKERES